MAPERVAYYLDIWCEWMHKDSGVRGYGARVPVIGVSHASDFDAMLSENDNKFARATNACIDDLELIERIAINHKILAAVWRSRLDLNMIYDRAVVKLGLLLERKGFF